MKTKKKSPSLPSNKSSVMIRLLWHSIYNLAEIATDLEDASSNSRPLKLSPRQKELLSLIEEINDRVTHFSADFFSLVSTQQQWLEFLEDLIRSTKTKQITEERAKEILKIQCIECFQTDEKDYAEIAKKFRNKNDNSSELHNLRVTLELLEQHIRNDERRMTNPKQSHFVQKSFIDLNLETFIKNVWKLPRDTQGPMEDARAMLSKILVNSSPTSTRHILKENYTKHYPVYFHNEDFLDKPIVLLRIIEEFGIPLTADLKKSLIDQIKPRTYFYRTDVPSVAKYKKYKTNRLSIEIKDGWS